LNKLVTRQLVEEDKNTTQELMDGVGSSTMDNQKRILVESSGQVNGIKC
jgi:hypothetical protein